MDRKRQGEDLWRQKFEVFGLSEHFIFVCRDWASDNGRKCRIRCRNCGETFSTWNVNAVFKGKCKTVICPECGMRSDGILQWTKTSIRDEAIAFYLQGHTINEIADKFDISPVQFENVRRLCGIHKTNEQKKQAWIVGLKKASEKAHKNASDQAEQKRVKHLDSLGFDFIERSESRGTIRCRKCGYEFEYTLAHLTKGNVICKNCKKLSKEEQELRKKENIEERKRQKEAERITKNPNGLSKYQLERESKLDEVYICRECGREYTPREYAESVGIKTYSNPGFCSNICKKRSARRKQADIKTIRHRAKKYGSEFDSSVTLKKLILRDGLRCGICGGLCDPNDHEWTVYFGPTSPTIDHIRPLSKGGSHTWDNVQVAHAICNSKKRDIYEAC